MAIKSILYVRGVADIYFAKLRAVQGIYCVDHNKKRQL